MPRIKWVDENEATGEVAELYDHIRARRSTTKVMKSRLHQKSEIGDILKCFSPHPGALRGVIQLSDTLHFKDGALSGAEKEMIATYVSALNSCQY